MGATFIRTLFCTVVIATNAWGEELPPDSSILEVVATGDSRTLDMDSQARIKFWLQQLMLSALYQDLVTESSTTEWEEYRNAQTRVYFRYASRATLAIPERGVLTFDEVLLPWAPADTLHWIFVKKNDEVHRLVMWNPWVYVQLVTEAGISLHPSWQQVQRGEW